MKAQDCRRAARAFNNAVRALEHLKDMQSLQVLQGLRLIHRRRGYSWNSSLRRGWRAIQKDSVKLQYRPLGQNPRSLDNVLQYANVTGPGVRVHAVHAAGAKALDGFAEPAAKTVQEESDEETDVRHALTERRDLDGDDIETIQQIKSKSSVANRLIKISIRGGDHADADPDRSAAADWLELLLLEHAEQLYLGVERELANLVEKNRAAMGELEPADALLDRPSKRAFDVSEQLALDEARRDRTAADFYEWPVVSLTATVDGAGEQLLPGTGFPQNEDC